MRPSGRDVSRNNENEEEEEEKEERRTDNRGKTEERKREIDADRDVGRGGMGGLECGWRRQKRFVLLF